MYIFRSRDKRELGPRGYMPAGVYYWATTRHERDGHPIFTWAPTAAKAKRNLQRRYQQRR